MRTDKPIATHDNPSKMVHSVLVVSRWTYTCSTHYYGQFAQRSGWDGWAGDQRVQNRMDFEANVEAVCTFKLIAKICGVKRYHPYTCEASETQLQGI